MTTKLSTSSRHIAGYLISICRSVIWTADISKNVQISGDEVIGRHEKFTIFFNACILFKKRKYILFSNVYNQINTWKKLKVFNGYNTWYDNILLQGQLFPITPSKKQKDIEFAKFYLYTRGSQPDCPAYKHQSPQ